MKVNLSYRSYQEEIMDDFSDNSKSLYLALKELDIINQYLGGNQITLSAVKKMLLKNPRRVWKIVDLGCGSGEMLLKIAKWCRKKRIDVELIGIDANANVVSYAQKHCEQYPEITFQSQDILSDSFSVKDYDIVLCTLFLHHFTDEQLIGLFQKFTNKGQKLIVNDLHRHWFAYYAIKILTRLFSKSSMVQNDACLSVWRAFKKTELKALLKKAGIKQYQLGWRWAFRWKLIAQ